MATMHTYRIPLLTATVILLTACSADADRQPATDTPSIIRLTATVDAAAYSRAATNLQAATLTQPATAGVYVLTHDATTAVSGYGYENMAVSGVDNQGYLQTTSMYYPGSGSIDVYVYAPRPTSGASLTAMPITVAANQSTTDAYVASDFLYGKTASVAYNNAATPINVAMSHTLSKLILNVTAGSGSPALSTDNLTQVTLGSSTKPVQTSTTVNLSTGAVATAATPASTITLVEKAGGVVTGFDSNALTTACILPPQTLTGCPVTLTIDGLPYTALLTTPDGGFTKGNAYTYNVTVDLQGISIALGSITGWTTANNGNNQVDFY